jgi:hypothetical protein
VLTRKGGAGDVSGFTPPAGENVDFCCWGSEGAGCADCWAPHCIAPRIMTNSLIALTFASRGHGGAKRLRLRLKLGERGTTGRLSHWGAGPSRGLRRSEKKIATRIRRSRRRSCSIRMRRLVGWRVSGCDGRYRLGVGGVKGAYGSLGGGSGRVMPGMPARRRSIASRSAKKAATGR